VRSGRCWRMVEPGDRWARAPGSLEDRALRCPEIDDRAPVGVMGADRSGLARGLEDRPGSMSRVAPRWIEGSRIARPGARGSSARGSSATIAPARIARVESRARRVARSVMTRGAAFFLVQLLQAQRLGGLWKTCQIGASYPQAVENLWIMRLGARAVIVSHHFCYR
jgi:hypothetical protein